MACNPTRLELSNAATTTVTITLASDPGDGTTVTLEVDGLAIDTSATTSGGSASFTITAVSAANNSLWDATIQVGSNRPATAEVLVVETNTTQAIGVTIDDSSVTYCAPSAGGGGATVLNDLTDVTISLPIAKQVLYYNGADWRNVSLSAGDIPNLDASKTTSGTFDAARIPDLSSLYADAAAAVPAGGTTGQVLAKASGTDYDLTWSTATTGTVASVGLSVPGGFTVAGTNPITGSGTFEITSTLSGVIVGDGAATFSGDGVINDLADVNIAMGAGNEGDLLYYNHAAGAGSKIKGIARSSIGLSEFDPDLGLGDLDDVTLGLLSDNLFIAYSNATSQWTGRSPAAARTALGLGPYATASTITDSYLMLIESPSDKTYTLDARVAADRTVTAFYAKTASGTCTATLKNLTDATTIGTISVTSTGGSAASLTNTGLTATDRIAIEISSSSSPADLEMVVEFTQ